MPDYRKMFEKILHDNGMPVDENAVQSEFNELVRSEGLITNTSRYSPFWRLISAIVIKPYIWIRNVFIETVLMNMFLMTAGGTFLDLFANAVNLERKPATLATGEILFTKTNKNQSVVVPAGSIVSSPEINGVVYQLKTTQACSIPAGIESVRVPVVAVGTGENYNLAAGYYRYLVNPIDGITVTNDDDWLISPGANIESDDDLRDRTKNQYNFVGHYHTDAVYRGIVTTITGISTRQVFFVHDAPRGPGTANLYLLLNDGVDSKYFIDTVNNYIMGSGHRGHGDDLRCYALPDKKIDVAVTVYFERDQQPFDQTQYLTNVENFIRCAFRQNNDYSVTQVNAYSRFSISKLCEELHEQFNELHSIVFDIGDIVSELEVPRLRNLTVRSEVAE